MRKNYSKNIENSGTKSIFYHHANSAAASDSSQGCAGTNSFVMVDGSGDDIDDFLAEEATTQTGQRMQRPNNLALSNQRSIGSDEWVFPLILG